MTFTVAVANRKGGVAKTTTAANLADLAARRGQRVLLVDLDPQGNASDLTDAAPRESAPNTFGVVQRLTIADALYFALEKEGAVERPGTVLSVVVEASSRPDLENRYWSSGLHVAPANEDLATRGDERFDGSDHRLAIAMQGAEQHYDLVLIDCPPSLGSLFFNALHAADAVLLVTEPADNSLEGLPRTVEVLQRIRAQRGGRQPVLAGLVITNLPARETLAQDRVDLLREEYGEQLWEVVPRRSVVRRAEAAHSPVVAFGAEARDVTEAYERVVDRLLALAETTTKEIA